MRPLRVARARIRIANPRPKHRSTTLPTISKRMPTTSNTPLTSRAVPTSPCPMTDLTTTSPTSPCRMPTLAATSKTHLWAVSNPTDPAMTRLAVAIARVSKWMAKTPGCRKIFPAAYSPHPFPRNFALLRATQHGPDVTDVPRGSKTEEQTMPLCQREFKNHDSGPMRNIEEPPSHRTKGLRLRQRAPLDHCLDCLDD